jgi:hypothetical protein
MTEQQEHLISLIRQRESLGKELENLNSQSVSTRETFFKVQGAIEYLQQVGVSLPETQEQVEESESSETDD